MLPSGGVPSPVCGTGLEVYLWGLRVRVDLDTTGDVGVVHTSLPWFRYVDIKGFPRSRHGDDLDDDSEDDLEDGSRATDAIPGPNERRV